MRKSGFIRRIMQVVAMGGLITAVLWLNQPLHLPKFNLQEAMAQTQSKAPGKILP
ncbi:hypothetical protein N752_04175 [Desulforamulus aquiferis]|nr:hypothetical protein [Desulforamulus aquiferis]RYD06531.1 hypothetical protein N752_04175 [Desulforamulus aquiferis]